MRDRLLMLVALTLLTTTPAMGGERKPDKAPDTSMVAAIGPGGARLGRKATLPQVLSSADIATYQRVEELQAKSQWGLADRELAKLQDETLKGAYLAQRIQHRHYRAKFPELQAWMAAYSDMPEAEAVYRVALKARPGKNAVLKAPVHGYLSGTGITGITEDDGANWEDYSIDGAASLTPAERKRLRAVRAKVRDLVDENDSAAARAVLADRDVARLFGPEFGVLKAHLAVTAFANGDDAAAIQWAVEATEISDNVGAHWTAGLALWRQNQLEPARRHFEAVANAAEASSWLSSAGAYWAARANLVTHRPHVVNHWLEVAAAHPRTLYGLMARHALGQDVQYQWSESRPFTDMDVDVLTRVKGGKRAFAYLQMGNKQKAEEELRKLQPTATSPVAQSMLALANAGGMPGLALTLVGKVAGQDGRFHDSAAFPIPEWNPKGGWTIDKSLVYALARQESGFNPKARSQAGAAGLMQLMPATANFIGGRGSREKLSDPEQNLNLGQRYVHHLLRDEGIKGNLMLMAAAYNAGPNNSARWYAQIQHRQDPLLFMESIPNHETRVFVEKVLTNYWVYRDRMGQPAGSLESIVSNQWPMYDGAGTEAHVVSRNVKN